MSRRKTRRKSNSATVYIPLAVLFISMLSVLGVSFFLRIIEVEVLGASKYSNNEILSVSGILVGDNLLFLDSSAIERKICAAMPYINSVSIEISLPDKVMINVSETNAVAVIEHLSNALVIDQSGKVLEELDYMPSGLISIHGFFPSGASVGSQIRVQLADDTRLRYMVDLLSAFEEDGLSSLVSSVDVTNIAYTSFVYRERFTVIIGTTDNVRNKLISLPGIVADIERESPNESFTIHMTDREAWRYAPDR